MMFIICIYTDKNVLILIIQNWWWRYLGVYNSHVCSCRIFFKGMCIWSHNPFTDASGWGQKFHLLVFEYHNFWCGSILCSAVWVICIVSYMELPWEIRIIFLFIFSVLQFDMNICLLLYHFKMCHLPFDTNL